MANGDLYFKYGSVAIHIFSLPFLKQEALSDLPLHLAHKKIPICDDQGVTRTPKAPNGYKFEKFIFDVLPDAENVAVLAFERRNEFSPVKNGTGENSPETCKRDLAAKWARWLKAAGIDVPCDANGYPVLPIEIDPCFAVNPEILRERLLTKPDVTKPIWLKG
jgi:UDP-N-acetylglucosamine/UDP-N-acetylgalactosamine diphosphorylase